MFKCHVCGSSKANHQLITEVFQIRDRFYQVENIPVLVCQNCGEEIFSRETTKNIQQRTNAYPVRKIRR